MGHARNARHMQYQPENKQSTQTRANVTHLVFELNVRATVKQLEHLIGTAVFRGLEQLMATRPRSRVHGKYKAMRPQKRMVKHMAARRSKLRHSATTTKKLQQRVTTRAHEFTLEPSIASSSGVTGGIGGASASSAVAPSNSCAAPAPAPATRCRRAGGSQSPRSPTAASAAAAAGMRRLADAALDAPEAETDAIVVQYCIRGFQACHWMADLCRFV